MSSLKHIKLNNQINQRGADGFFDLAKDQEAIEELLKEIDSKTIKFSTEEERLKYLIKERLYYDFLDEYDMDFVLSLTEEAYTYKFQFQSYMALSKFYKDYGLRTLDKKNYLENYEQHVVIVALFLAGGDKDKAKRYMKSMMEQRYQPATPTFLNSGRVRRGELVSCYLLEIDDSLNSINYIDSTARQLSKLGGGVAINLSKLRERGSSIKGIKNTTKGVVPVAKMLEYSFDYADQAGQRPGAGAVYLNIFHHDIIEFLDTKKINADEDVRLATISTGIIIPEKFFEFVKTGEDFNIFKPYSIFKEYNKHLDDMDMDKMYDELSTNPKIEKEKINARKLLNKIAQTQLQSGYPYLFFKDNANKVHPLKKIGQVKMSNLCTEIMQLQETSIINNYGEKDEIKRDILCNLGSLNIVNVMERKNIKESVFTAMEALTDVSDMLEVENAPGVAIANKDFHAVGLGAMNLHGFLAKNKINYESKEARDFANVFFAAVNYYSIEKSMNLAKEKQQKFKDFDKSEYASGKYFVKYIENDFLPKYEMVENLFVGIELPTKEGWKNLAEEVKKYGLYNAYRLSIAPTQSISYIQNATSSVMPIVNLIERRSYGNAETYYPAPFLSPQTQWYYKEAFNTNMYRLIDMISIIQEHVDQGISTILFVDSMISTRDMARLYVYAHMKNLKSLYYTRTKLLDVEECISCSV